MRKNNEFAALTKEEQIVIYKLDEKLRQVLKVEELPIVYLDRVEESTMELPTQVSLARIIINKKYKTNVLKIASSLCFQYRKLFQMEYAPFIDNKFNTQWVKELRHELPIEEYTLELDAYAYTKYALKEYSNSAITFPNIDEKKIDDYITKNKGLLECEIWKSLD